jgi:hypothetical protein
MSSKMIGRRGGTNGDAKVSVQKPEFMEVQVDIGKKQCAKNFLYVAVVVERDELGVLPTRVVYGKTYPAIGIEVPENKCAVLVGKNAATQISDEIGGGFIVVAPEDIIVLQGQSHWSDRNIGQFANVQPNLFRPTTTAGSQLNRFSATAREQPNHFATTLGPPIAAELPRFILKAKQCRVRSARSGGAFCNPYSSVLVSGRCLKRCKVGERRNDRHRCVAIYRKPIGRRIRLSFFRSVKPGTFMRLWQHSLVDGGGWRPIRFRFDGIRRDRSDGSLEVHGPSFVVSEIGNDNPHFFLYPSKSGFLMCCRSGDPIHFERFEPT